MSALKLPSMRVLCCWVVFLASVAAAEPKKQPKPWDDPHWNDPQNAWKREQLEFTTLFNSARERPAKSLRLLKQNPGAYKDPDRFPPTILLGNMLWHSSKLLGPRASVFGVSCNSCHPNGAVTNTIDAGESTDKRGNVDLLSDYFTPLADDGVWAPRNVASLRGARFNWPYLRNGGLHSLSEGVVATITGEFGLPSRPEYVGALTAFLFEQDFLPNAQLDSLGRLTAKAPDAAREGEKVFKAAREGFGGRSCASCHVPDSFFTDHRNHSLAHGIGEGTMTPGEAFKTSTLINLVESWPYFFDGSATTLGEAVEQIDARHGLGLSAADKTKLTAYLTAVGAIDTPARVPTLEERFEEALAFLSLTLVGPYKEDAGIWELTLDAVRHELRGAMRDAESKDRARVEPLVLEYEKLIAAAPAQTPNDATRAALRALRSRLQLAAVPNPGGGGAKRSGSAR